MSKKLYKSVNDKKVSGVCGGLAKYFNIDVTLIRIVVAFLTIITGGAIIGSMYLACAFIMPDDPDEVVFNKTDTKNDNNTNDFVDLRENDNVYVDVSDKDNVYVNVDIDDNKNNIN